MERFSRTFSGERRTHHSYPISREYNARMGGGGTSWSKIIRRNRKLVAKLFAWIVVVYGFVQFYNWTQIEYGNPASLNYFLDSSSSVSLEYSIDTPKCKILKMSPWDKSILPFIKPKFSPPECTSRNKHWTFVKNAQLYVNRSAVLQSGYSLKSLRCCYKIIIRVEQNYADRDFGADNQVKYSDECHKMSVPVQDEFIRVFCTVTSWPFMGEVVYRAFHAIPLLARKSSKAKVDTWKAKGGIKIPPSIVMIGIDSLSRMNFHRSFNETQEVLRNIGAVELLGYTKVGENTHPNTVAFLAGYSHNQLAKTCLRSTDIPQDDCPYIWKEFSKAGYLTATIEDAPGLVGFNYLKLGFVNRPTDFYFRPFMLAVHKTLPRSDYYHTDCIGHSTTEETLLSYIEGIAAYSKSAPVFVHSWMTSLAHLDINGARFADSTVARFIRTLDLSNTILVVLSDHGQRYGAIRETLAGWYEDKLPIVSIYLPPKVTSEHPEWKQNLLLNSKRLASPFDLYKTMEHVLKTYSSNKSIEFNEERTPSGQHIQRNLGQSLFIPINSQRSCTDAGIPVNYCACLPPNKLNKTDPLLKKAAETAVTYLNEAISQEKCAQATLYEVVAGAVMESGDGNERSYVVTFFTTPGNFMFEANVEVRADGKFHLTTDLLRMNKIDRKADCVDTSLLERYCYCL